MQHHSFENVGHVFRLEVHFRVSNERFCKRTRFETDGQGNSEIRSDEGLTLETSALESLYGGQFALLKRIY